VNNLKQTATGLLFILLVFCPPVKAQIILGGTPTVFGIGCKHSTLGKIHVTVKSIYPPYTFKWNTGQTTEEIKDLEAGDYTVTIKDANGADTTLHFSIEETDCDLEPELFFTPNGDGYNDYWDIVYAAEFPDALIVVYNKLGQVVFRHVGLYDLDHRWDGTDLTGIPLPVSTYFFVAFADRSNRKNVRKGTVSIIR
jgi:gliding motility-associated-like protein